LERIAKRMADLLACAAGLGGDEALLERLRTSTSTGGIAPAGARICFSGGVAECMARMPEDPLAYGDLGVLLGRALLEGRLCREAQVIPALERISATVIGAGIYTTSLSGSTIYYQPGIFPVKNVPALRLEDEVERACVAGDGGPLAAQVEWFMRQGDATRLLVCLKGMRDPSYDALAVCARTLCGALDKALPEDAPVLIAVESDTAKALGTLMARISDGKRRIAVIDAVHPMTGEFVDIGPPVMSGMVVPVAVKTLLFG